MIGKLLVLSYHEIYLASHLLACQQNGHYSRESFFFLSIQMFPVWIHPVWKTLLY